MACRTCSSSSRDYDSVYTKPDNTQNKAYLFNLVATHKVSDTLTLVGERVSTATSRPARSTATSMTIRSARRCISRTRPSARRSTEAGYTGFPTSGETQDNTPFPSWRCIANILLNDEPNEKCNGLVNQTRTRPARRRLLGAGDVHRAARRQRRISSPSACRCVDSRATFAQSSQFGFLTPDRGIDTVDGDGAFADGTQESENAFDARVDLDRRFRRRAACT